MQPLQLGLSFFFFNEAGFWKVDPGHMSLEEDAMIPLELWGPWLIGLVSHLW